MNSSIVKDITRRLKNSFFIVMVTVGLLILLIILFASMKLNITSNKTAKKIKFLNKELNTYFGTVKGLRQSPEYIQSLIDYSDPNDAVSKSTSGFYLRDFYIASSSNTIVCNKMFDGFINIDMIGTVLDNGARLISLDIFSDSYCDNGKPVVSKHIPKYDYLYNEIGTFNYLDFDACCQKIMSHAFVKNDDPLILVLKLHLNKQPESNRENILEQMTSIVTNRFKGRLLGSDYSYQRTIIANAPIEDLFGKIIIICDKGFPGTTFDELVNYSWKEKSTIANDSKAPLLMLYYTSTQMNGINSQGFELLKVQNKKGMTFVDADNGKSSTSVNYNINFCWDSGCSLVGIDYSNLTSISTYQSKFSEYSLVLKPEELRYKQEYITYNSYQDPSFSMEGRPIDGDSDFTSGLVM